MKRSLTVVEQAENDVREIIAYYHNEKEELAQKFEKALLDVLQYIEKKPEAFQIKQEQFRCGIIKKFPYLVVYEIEETKIVVYSVTHEKRDPETRYSKR